MKKAAVFLMILTLSVSSAACGNKEKDDNQADAKTEQTRMQTILKIMIKVILRRKRQTIRCTSYLRRTMYGL